MQLPGGVSENKARFYGSMSITSFMRVIKKPEMQLFPIESKNRKGDLFFISSCKTFGNCNCYQTSLHRHLIIMDSLLCFSLGKETPSFL